MNERLLRLPVRNALSVLLMGLMFSMAAEAQAQEGTLPRDCYRADGFVDLAECSVPHWNIPASELSDGYWGHYGRFFAELPPYEFHTFLPDNYLVGNATYAYNMDDFLAEKALQWNIPPEQVAQFRGGIIIDSCGAMGQTAWFRVNGAEWQGPFLVVDCAGYIHHYDRECILGAVAELDASEFLAIQQGGGLMEHVEIFIADRSNLSAPPADLGRAPTNFPETFLDSAGLPCRNDWTYLG